MKTVAADNNTALKLEFCPFPDELLFFGLKVKLYYDIVVFKQFPLS